MTRTPPRRSSRATSPVPAVLAVAAGATALACAAVLLSHGRAGTPFCAPACLEARLGQMLRADGSLDPASLAASRALLRAQLAFSPFETGAWLRLAALEADAAGGPLNATANQALETSYRYAPVHLPTARWRLAFVFDHWSEAAPAVRNAAEREVRSLSASPNNLRALGTLAPQIRDPAGRLAFRLLLDQMSR